jgi:two-component system OmpR family sensor kinase
MKLPDAFRSIRASLALWYAFVALLGSIVFGVGVYVYLQRVLVRELNDDLVAEVAWIQDLIRVEQTQSAHEELETLVPEVQKLVVEHFDKDPRNYIVLVSTAQQETVYELKNPGYRFLLDVPIDKTQITFARAADNNETKLYIASAIEGGFHIRVAFPETHIRDVLARIVEFLVLLSPVVVFVSLSGGWFLAGHALRPVRDIANRASHITSENLHERLPERRVNDELGVLITTFNVMIARLEASFSQMKEFLLNVTHELRTPLTILRGTSELALGRQLSNDAAQDLATTFLEETGRMSRLVDDLLMLARADAGQLTLQRDPVDLTALVEEIYEDVSLLASAKSVITTKDIRAHDVAVVGDSARLRQLFRILISNAIRYTKPSGAITIAFWIDNAAYVSIKDTGIGIAKEDIENIFHRFYRSDVAYQHEKSGSGLGLPIARWIALAHGGNIAVESELGGGSTFTVRLPLNH